MKKSIPTLFVLLMVFAILSPGTAAQTADGKPYSPYVGRDFPVNVYFGDTHLHTNLSFDAYADGNSRNGPDEAYRWAKGATLPGEDGVLTRMGAVDSVAIHPFESTDVLDEN